MTTQAIDIHTHIVPAEFPDYAGKHGGAHWPSMAAAHDCHHKNVMIDGKNFRTVSDQCWDVGRRAEAMAQMGIARQVLSPMPELLSYWLPLDDAAPLIRHVNDTIAAMVARAPDKFIGLGGVPMQDPDAAARELERLMRDGFRGVELGSNVNGAGARRSALRELLRRGGATGRRRVRACAAPERARSASSGRPA